MHNYVIGLVGPSGSGKSTLILEALTRMPGHLSILKSTSTRDKRSDEDNLFYNLISKEAFLEKRQNNDFANFSEYANHYYGYEWAEIKKTLSNSHGICAIVEPAVIELRKQQVPIKIVKIIPEQQTVFRGLERQAADLDRSKLNIEVDCEIINSFQPNGLSKAVNQLVNFINQLE